MSTRMPNSGRTDYYTVEEAAWLLGIPRHKISKAIRTGAIPTVRRRSRPVVPAYVLQRLLDEPRGGESP
jgi:excisionase family DNA binding protein